MARSRELGSATLDTGRIGLDSDQLAVDRRVLLALERRDKATALAILMEGYGDSLYRYCYNVLRSATMADDVHQSVFVQVFQDFETFSGRSFRPWLYAIAHHRCLDALKASRRWFKRFSFCDPLPEEPDPGPNSEERLVRYSLASELNACLGKLEPHVRIAILLRYQEGFTYEEMAKVCQERPATLQARVARAMPTLRRCLEAKGVRL
ncbi:RNA polymerase sigma factor [Sorangium sp. So ce295]|uniref:RNA polymerase sigma factor n=1 Tax=Sorangium sp. So ce295 TaxID=3133295 RepID=UPI003F5D8908